MGARMEALETIAMLEANADHWTRKSVMFLSSREVDVSDYYAGMESGDIVQTIEPILTKLSMGELEKYVLPLLDEEVFSDKQLKTSKERLKKDIYDLLTSESFIDDVELRGVKNYRVGVISIVGSDRERISQLHTYLTMIAEMPLRDRVIGRVIEERLGDDIYEIVFEREEPVRFNPSLTQLWLRAYKNRNGEVGTHRWNSFAIKSEGYREDMPAELYFELNDFEAITFFDGKLDRSPGYVGDVLEDNKKAREMEKRESFPV